MPGSPAARAVEAGAEAMLVVFRSRGPSGRRWQAKFDLGSGAENALAALRHAWTCDADIEGAIPADPAPAGLRAADLAVEMETDDPRNTL